VINKNKLTKGVLIMKSLKQMLTDVNNKKIDYKALVYSQFTDTIKNYSTISFDTIKINDYEVSNNMYQRSGSKAYNPITHKHLHHLYDLGEPFVVNYKFYYPIEYWTFALATSKANWGKMGWKHG